MNTKYLTEEDFIKRVFDFRNHPDSWKFSGERPCVVDFFVSGCETCESIVPILKELAETYRGRVDIYRVDTEKESNLASIFGIRSVPSILLCPMNDIPKIINGPLPKEQYVVLIDTIVLEHDII